LNDSGELLWDRCTNHNKLLVVAHVFTIKSDHGLNETVYDRIFKWANILPKKNRLKEKFYVTKSMMKPPGLGYHKIFMFLNFKMLYYLENTELTECRTCGHACYKLKTGKRTLITYRKLRYFTITPKL
jgi:hypothetical protein